MASTFAHHFRQIHAASPATSDPHLAGVEARRFAHLPRLLSGTPPTANPNPFAFLSRYLVPRRTHLVRSILASLLPLGPRSLSHPPLRLLLAHTLSSPHPLSTHLTLVHSFLRSGLPLPNQTRLSLSHSWLARRAAGGTVSSILAESGYASDRNVVNYLISSLCAVDEVAEAEAVLKGSGTQPDSEAYGVLIQAVCEMGRVKEAAGLVREMVGRCGVVPRGEAVVRLVAAMLAEKEVGVAREVVGWLEKMGVEVGFESYEKVLEGWLRMKEFTAAGEVVVAMAAKGFIPRFEARLRVVEGLAAAGELGFAGKIRRVLGAMNP